MTKQEVRIFKELFSKYCNEKIKKGHCYADKCDDCPVNNAYSEIFNADNLESE